MPKHLDIDWTTIPGWDVDGRVASVTDSEVARELSTQLGCEVSIARVGYHRRRLRIRSSSSMRADALDRRLWRGPIDWSQVPDGELLESSRVAAQRLRREGWDVTAREVTAERIARGLSGGKRRPRNVALLLARSAGVRWATQLWVSEVQGVPVHAVPAAVVEVCAPIFHGWATSNGPPLAVLDQLRGLARRFDRRELPTHDARHDVGQRWHSAG